MKGSKQKAALPEFAAQGLKALEEAVAEVHEESRRTGKPIPIWRDGKVVWIIPEKETPPPRVSAPRSAKRGSGRRGNNKR
jgi:hypothetical protein